MSGKQRASKQSCTVTIRPRLHATLIGMDASGYRKNGGLGFCIDGPHAQVRVFRSNAFSIHDLRVRPLQNNELLRLLNSAKEFAKRPIQIEISGEMPSHFGFGSATGMRLGMLEAVAAVFDKHIDRDLLIRISGRGGTSGIGVTTYFEGGLVFDVGTAQFKNKSLPSSAIEGIRSPPLVLCRIEMPKWKLGLCIPSNIPPQTHKQEIAFFKRACPISSRAVNEILYQTVYGVIASAKERNFPTFCEAIKAIQRTRWKKLERHIYGSSLLKIENSIYELGAQAVGMSSLGPGLFFFSKNIETTVSKLRSAYPSHFWTATSFFNSGRHLTCS